MSSVIFPVRNAVAAEPGAPRPGLLLPLPARLGGGGSSITQRELEVLKAVAAAVAISHTVESLTLAREAQRDDEDPGTRLKDIDADDLAVVLDEVRRIQGNRSGAAGPDEEQRVVAAAVGADAVLVAAAHAKVKESAAVSKAARDWVAAIDPRLLETAARAGARREFLNAPKPPADLAKQIAALDERLTRIEKGGAKGRKRGGGKTKKRTKRAGSTPPTP
jgi:hypothetical protein